MMSLTAAAFVGVVTAVIISVTTPSQRDAAVVITGEVSGRIAGHFIWERGRHTKLVIVEHNLALPKSQKNGLQEPEVLFFAFVFCG